LHPNNIPGERLTSPELILQKERVYEKKLKILFEGEQIRSWKIIPK
jgi:hypothetical protein